MTERLRAQAVEDFTCSACDARPGRPCRRMSTDWTGRRPMWKRAPLHRERLALAEHRVLQSQRRAGGAT